MLVTGSKILIVLRINLGHKEKQVIMLSDLIVYHQSTTLDCVEVGHLFSGGNYIILNYVICTGVRF